MKKEEAKIRLEEIRVELRAECISYGELAELSDLVEFIEEDDVELLEAAGVPEFECTRCNGEMRIKDYENGDLYSDDGKMPC
jgi:hypothetical protein